MPFRKKVTFVRIKYFLIQHHFVFVDMKYFFVLHQLFFRWHEILFRATSTHFSRHQITFCVTSNFFFQHKIIFRATPNFCLGHRLECYVLMICFYCHIANENIITCQKINKLSFLCDTKKLVSFLVHHNFFIFSFYITHCQHVDLLRSGTGKKEMFSPSFTHLSDIPKQLLSKSCSWKKVSYYLGLMFVKRLRGAHILVKLLACFSQILQKLIP